MRIFLILLLLPLKMFSQSIEGVWTGTLYNDTTKKNHPYEIAITEKKGKPGGFSHTIFLENNKEVAGVKTLKIKRKGDKLLIEDDELIYNNYGEPAPKGVKQFSVLNIMQSDSGWVLVGVFNTNKTKEYASLTGTIYLRKKEKIIESKIIPKLEELNLFNTLSFIQPTNKNNDVAVLESNPKVIQTSPIPGGKEKETVIFLPKMQKPITTNDNDDNDAEPLMITIKEDTINYKADVIKEKELKTKTVFQKEVAKISTLPVNKPKPIPPSPPKKQIVSVPESVKKQIIAASRKDPIIKKTITNVPPVVVKKEIVATVSVPKVNKSTVAVIQPAIKQNQVKPQPVNPENKLLRHESKTTVTAQTPVTKTIISPTTFNTSEKISGRKIETIRTVDFKSDSLILTLYDNGVVDGDTVTVILNGKIIMPKQGLSTVAITKTIYITPDLGDSLQLIMYAENLGSIPPNTGLLIIQDGEERYQIRFAGDLQKNSAIILRRKR